MKKISLWRRLEEYRDTLSAEELTEIEKKLSLGKKGKVSLMSYIRFIGSFVPCTPVLVF